MNTQGRKNLLISMTALVWAAALGFAYAGRVKLAARAPTEVTLTTWPPAVRLTINGEKQHGGAYVVTPIKLLLTAGRNRLTISRDGYYAQSSEIEDTSGRKIDMNNVVLQRSNEQTFAPVEIDVAEGAPPLLVEVDDGFAAGETPVTFDDLVADTPHILSVREKDVVGEEKRPVKLRCRFVPPAADGESAPFKIRIKASGSSFKATGCAKLKTKAPRP